MKVTRLPACGFWAFLLVIAATPSMRARQAPQAGAWSQVQDAIRSLPPFSQAEFEAALSRAVAALEQWIRNNPSPPPSPGTGERWVVVLRHHGMGGTFAVRAADQPDRCPGVNVGDESLVGIVERRRVPTVWADGIEYSGILGRQTSTGLCEVRDTSDGEKWCTGLLNGSGPVEVKIILPGDGEHDDFEVDITPIANATTVVVDGHCNSLDNVAVARQYREKDTLMFELPDERPPAPRPTLHQALRHGHLYPQERGAAPWREGQYTMWVSRIGAPPPIPREQP